MAEKTAIAWTRSTFNPWIGCTRVGQGCDQGPTLDDYLRALEFDGLPSYWDEKVKDRREEFLEEEDYDRQRVWT